MKIYFIENLHDLNEVVNENLNIVLGFFDGCHKGHELLINEAKKFNNNKIGLFTFDRNIKEEGKILFDLESRMSVFESLGVDYLYIFKVSNEFKNTSYIDFINNYLKLFSTSFFFCGKDYSFGKGGEGKVINLIESGLHIEAIDFVLDHNGNKLSSTTIRNLVESGNIELANNYLSKNYFVSGQVIHGFNNGGKILFPTANIKIGPKQVIPKEGVYITKVKIFDKEYISITNVGKHPTIEMLNEPILETYILDFNAKIYEKKINVIFYKRIRNEIKFESIDELKLQIENDIKEVKNFFTNQL